MKENVMTKRYMSDNEKFADAFNYALYDGMPVIHPEDLKECDGNEIFLKENRQGEITVRDKQRDILKKCVIKQDKGMNYILLGIEDQSDVHYAMPVRNMLYDALNYAEQVDNTVARHRKEKDLTGAEFLSGFSKKDRILPVITLVVYFGTGQWDGPRTLHEMFDIQDERIWSHINDYKLNLIVPEEIQNTEKFQSDLKYVMDFIKNSMDKKKLKEIIEENKEYFSNVPVNTAMLLKHCANVNVQVKEEEEINMCKAIDDMIEDAREEGRQEMEKKMCKAIEDMKEDAREEGRQEMEKKMYKAIEDMKEDAREEVKQEMEKKMCKAIEDMKEDAREEERQKMEKEQEQIISNILQKLEPEMVISFGYDRETVMKIQNENMHTH